MIDDELSPEARALLDAARPALGPDPAAIARMHRNIAASVGAATLGASSAATASTKSSVAATGSSLAVKLGSLAVLGVLAIGAVIVVSRVRGAERSAQVSQPRVEQIAPQAPVPAPSSAPAAIVRDPGPEVAEVGEVREVSEVRAQEAPAPAPVVKSPPAVERVPPARPRPRAPAEASLAREVELIDQAMLALRNGDSAEALAAIHAHRHETRGAGQLAEDAAAIEIEALCRLGQPDVTAKLAAFDARFPRSAQRTRLTEACR